MKRLFKLPLIGRIGFQTDRFGSGRFNGDVMFETYLSVKVIRDGKALMTREVMNLNWLDKLRFGNKTSIDLGSGLVTHAGVRLLTQDTAISAGSATLNAMKYHGSGTGTTAAAALDTALQTAIGTTATLGANSNADASPNATFSAVGTIAYTGSYAVTEWGLFNSGTLAGATMWDHKVFAAINVISGDSIQITYTCTFNSGG